jgi:hypothetical protein
MNWSWLPFIIYCIFAIVSVLFGFKLGTMNMDLTKIPGETPQQASFLNNIDGYINKGRPWMMVYGLFWLIFWGVVIYYLTVTQQVGYA